MTALWKCAGNALICVPCILCVFHPLDSNTLNTSWNLITPLGSIEIISNFCFYSVYSTEMQIQLNARCHEMPLGPHQLPQHHHHQHHHHPPLCSILRGNYSCQSSGGPRAKLVISSVNPLESSLWNTNHSSTYVVSWGHDTHTDTHTQCIRVWATKSWSLGDNLPVAEIPPPDPSQSMWCNATYDPDRHVAPLADRFDPPPPLPGSRGPSTMLLDRPCYEVKINNPINNEKKMIYRHNCANS